MIRKSIGNFVACAAIAIVTLAPGDNAPMAAPGEPGSGKFCNELAPPVGQKIAFSTTTIRTSTHPYSFVMSGLPDSYRCVPRSRSVITETALAH
jgi:hypothetical protein